MSNLQPMVVSSPCWATAKSIPHQSMVSKSLDHSNKTFFTKLSCHKSKRFWIGHATAGNVCHTNADHHVCLIHHLKRPHSILSHGGCHVTIAAWITGLVVCQAHANANAVFKAAALIQRNGAIAMLILLVSFICTQWSWDLQPDAYVITVLTGCLKRHIKMHFSPLFRQLCEKFWIKFDFVPQNGRRTLVKFVKKTICLWKRFDLATRVHRWTRNKDDTRWGRWCAKAMICSIIWWHSGLLMLQSSYRTLTWAIRATFISNSGQPSRMLFCSMQR